MSDIEITMVPKYLFYHEVAYVRGLEKKNAELVAALEEAREALRLPEWPSKITRSDAIVVIDAALAAAGLK
jgi:hypothetical protein